MFYAEISNRGPAWLALLLVACFPVGGLIYSRIRLHALDIFSLCTLTVIAIYALMMALSPFVQAHFLLEIIQFAGPVATLAILTFFSGLIGRPLLTLVERFLRMQAGIHNGKQRLVADESTETIEKNQAQRLNMICAIAQLLLAGLVAGLIFWLADWPDLLFLLVIGIGYMGLGMWVVGQQNVNDNA